MSIHIHDVETVREPIIMYTKITRLYNLTDLKFNSIISIEKVSLY